jgi:uncharacterized protein with HEPN domain
VSRSDIQRSNIQRSDDDCLRDILDCIEAIDRAEAAVQRSPDDVEVAQVALDAVQHRVFTIEAAVWSLSLEVREDHPAIVWSDMARLHELVGADDHGLDLGNLRATIGEPLKRLRAACRAILAESVRAGEDEP